MISAIDSWRDGSGTPAYDCECACARWVFFDGVCGGVGLVCVLGDLEGGFERAWPENRVSGDGARRGEGRAGVADRFSGDGVVSDKTSFKDVLAPVVATCQGEEGLSIVIWGWARAC